MRSGVLVFALTASFIITVILQNINFDALEAKLYDFRVRHHGEHLRKNHVVLVKTFSESGHLSLDEHLLLLSKLSQANPKAIAYFLNFSDIFDSKKNADQLKAKKFVSFAKSLIQRQKASIWLSTDVGVMGEEPPPPIFNELPHRIAIIHKDGTTFAKDKITRRALFSVENEPSLHVELASLINQQRLPKEYRAIYSLPEVNAKFFLIHFLGSTEEKKHPFAEYSTSDILASKVANHFFENKIILIGTKNSDDTNDFVLTPYSQALFTNSKLTVHANIIETLIQNNATIVGPRWIDVALTFLLSFLIIIILFKTAPLKSMLITIACATIMALLSVAAFRWFHFWILISRPLIGILASYYFFVPYRLLREHRKRWQFQKKNEVLMQVEELKTNFMSLITHDLKTPVARIQGLTEILARSNTFNASIIEAIFKSTDELNHFINSILELTKIESKSMRLNKKSKDVNKVIEDCIEKYRFQAQGKKISLTTDLEPLFPIKIDDSLVSKVISSLIDNAIKYSEENAHISITSRESLKNTGYIEIQVCDTGIGISSQDLEHLCEKFYRSKNDHTIKNKGTGLGLYLSRYFLSLHHGFLLVDSKEGTGSIFTVLLPTEDHLSIGERHA